MKQIAPSMMCAEITQLAETLRIFEEENIEYLHIDIMDGAFVPNFTLGTDYIRQLRAATTIPLDIHLMITEPERKLDWFDFQPGELVSVHLESTVHLQRTLHRVKATGAKPMVALNPATPLSALDYVLPDIAGVLVMTVNPGFAGQAAIPQAIQKIADLRRYLDGRGYGEMIIEVDGNVSYDLAGVMSRNGADIFVGGSSSFFGELGKMAEGIRRLRACIA